MGEQKKRDGEEGGGVREGRRSSERIPSCCVKPREEYGCLFGGNRFQGRSGGLDNRMGRGREKGSVGGWRGLVCTVRLSFCLGCLFFLSFRGLFLPLSLSLSLSISTVNLL